MSALTKRERIEAASRFGVFGWVEVRGLEPPEWHHNPKLQMTEIQQYVANKNLSAIVEISTG